MRVVSEKHMKVLPVCSNTVIDADPHVWIPKDFDAFIRELDRIVEASGDALMFRGHADDKWLLESTFAKLQEGSPGIRTRTETARINTQQQTVS